jgi:hypothetical protein
MSFEVEHRSTDFARIAFVAVGSDKNTGHHRNKKSRSIRAAFFAGQVRARSKLEPGTGTLQYFAGLALQNASLALFHKAADGNWERCPRNPRLERKLELSTK